MRPTNAYDDRWYTERESALRTCFSYLFSGVGKLFTIMFFLPVVFRTGSHFRETLVSGFHFIPFAVILVIIGICVYAFISIWKIIPEYAELLSCFFVQPERTA